jgi:hypothetical protein
MSYTHNSFKVNVDLHENLSAKLDTNATTKAVVDAPHMHRMYVNFLSFILALTLFSMLRRIHLAPSPLPLIKEELIQEIQACLQYLFSPKRTSADVKDSHIWLRRSIANNKVILLEVAKVGLANYENVTALLVGNYLKSLLKKIPGDLIPKSSQKALIFLMNRGM